MTTIVTKNTHTKANSLPHPATSNHRKVIKTVQTSDFNGGFMHVIHQLYFSIQKHFEQELQKHKGISFSQFIIMVGLSCCRSEVTQARLAEHLMLTEATISRHISKLVEKKYLFKKKDLHNKKTYNLSISPLGRKAFVRAKKLIDDELVVCFSHVSEKDRETIITNFTKTISILHTKK